MRKILLALLAVATPALAQVHDEIALTRAEIQTERQAIVAENLQLSDAEGKTFWSMYRDYRNEMARNGDRTVKLIHQYAASLDTMTDEQATAMLDEAFAIEKEDLKIKTAWAAKLRKTFSPKTVMRFFQIENRLDAIVKVSVAAEIPLVEHTPKP